MPEVSKNKTYFARQIDEGMGMAVAKRTYLRQGECWADVARRVAEGNCSLVPTSDNEQFELTKAIAKASFLPAGRHLQHGDSTQKDRNIEVFSNCSTACASFIKFYLLLNGSGVGRMYNDDMMLIDWRNIPDMFFVLDKKHPDFNDFIKMVYRKRISDYTKSNEFNLRDQRVGYEMYFDELASMDLHKPRVHHQLADSREGWAKALEYAEVMAFEQHANEQLVLDFSLVREKGKPIKGMQNRPASGPAFTAYCFYKISRIKKDIFSFYDPGLNLEVERLIDPDRWLQTMLIDHYASECVANGGARRSARISVKVWSDPQIVKFINLKHDYVNSDGESILWSSNNSVGVDQEFWSNANTPGTQAHTVYQAIVDASFGHGTGEPGMVNLDKLTANEEGIPCLNDIVGP